MEQQIITFFNWLLLLGLCSLVAWCYGIHSTEVRLGQNPPRRSPPKESVLKQEMKALPAPTTDPCSHDKYLALLEEYNKLHADRTRISKRNMELWSADLAKADKRIKYLEWKVKEQTCEVERQTKACQEKEIALCKLEREHSACPSRGGVSKLDHNQAIADKEFECGQLRQHLAKLQYTLDHSRQTIDRQQEELVLLGRECQRRLEPEQVEQAQMAAYQEGRQQGRQEGEQETRALAEVLWDNHKAICVGVRAPMAAEAPSTTAVPVPETPVPRPVSPEMEALISSFDRMVLDTPETEREVSNSSPEDSHSFSQTGETVLAQGLHLQTAERTPVVVGPTIDQALFDPSLLAWGSSEGASQGVEQTLDVGDLSGIIPAEEVDALAADATALFGVDAQQVGGQARADGEGTSAVFARERELPFEFGRVVDSRQFEANFAGENVALSDVSSAEVALANASKQSREADKRVEDFDRCTRRLRKELNTSVNTGRWSQSTVDQKRDELDRSENTLRGMQREADMWRNRMDQAREAYQSFQ